MDERALSKLRWRCRRGMLENDLFLERFFDRHGKALTERNGHALGELMDLSDNDLLDLHLGGENGLDVLDDDIGRTRRRTAGTVPRVRQGQPWLDRDDVAEVLAMLRVSN